MIEMDILGRFEQLGSAIVADVFDDLGKTPLVVANNLRPLETPEKPVAGWAFTVSGKAETQRTSRDSLKLEAIDSMSPGAFAVWAGNGISGMCCFGDLLAGSMKARGVKGALVDGGIRDRRFMVQLGLPVYTRYVSPAQAIGRWRVTAYQERVQIAGALEPAVWVTPGDLVLADGDGAIIVPANLLPEVLARGEAALAKEGEARNEILRGLPLLEAIEKYGHL